MKGCGINPDLKAINQEGCFTIFQKKFVDNIGIVGGVLGFQLTYIRKDWYLLWK